MSYADVARRMPPVPMLAGETLGQWRGLTTDEQDRRKGEAWATDKAELFPLSWIGKLVSRWFGAWGSVPTDKCPDPKREANVQHLQHCKTIAAAHRAGVRADAGHADIVQEAHDSARDMDRRLQQRDIITPREWPEGVRLLALWAEVQAWLNGRGLLEFWERPARRSTLRPGTAAGRIDGMLRRTKCERRWRAVLRRVHAQAVEATAISLGLVDKNAGCYVSNEGLRSRAAQLVGNAAALEHVVAVNDRGQDFTVAELAAKGPANREIRRHELMTRIAGFEVICRQCDHVAMFVTVSCPSRMHRRRTVGQFGTEDNPSWDGTKPGEAQAYLVKQWKRFRSACDRWGVELYGFRIAEPHHDATPHWHALLFMPAVVGQGRNKRNKWRGRPVAMRLAARLLRWHFLRYAGTAKDRTEKGAKKHRVKVERIDWSKGSAAAYVAKYVSKNIDGYKVDADLYGNPTLTASRRVDAWASKWRIRQFQQIGGAPVGVWRELRRLHADQAAASPLVAMALDAVNVASQAEDIAGHQVVARTLTAAHGWAGYVELQGGHRVPRKALRIRLLLETTGELGRYGEPIAAKPAGVVTSEVTQEELPPVGIVLRPMRRTVHVTAEVESERCSWTVVARDAVPAVRDALLGGGKREGHGAAGRVPPWSPVNNCTRPAAPDVHPGRLFAPLVRRTRKVGRWHTWRPKRGPDDGTRSGDAAPDPTIRARNDDAGSGAAASR